MAMHPSGGRVANRQYNSPINLYSAANVRDVLDKETHMLYNGAVGIDFHQLSKPANLKNSAVLRMLEEEEYGHGRHGVKQVIWPPPQDESESYVTNGDRSERTAPIEQHQKQQPHSPISPYQAVSPQPVCHQQQQPSPRAWAPVHTPQQQQQQHSPAPAYRATPPPPPSVIQLRPSPPITQAPAPVFASQPATASLRGGINMRGDQKWPPATVKAQNEEENEKRRLLAKGPAFRPRKVKKDYSSFFAQHALNSTYPGYKAPPGTQHYTEDNRGVSHY